MQICELNSTHLAIASSICRSELDMPATPSAMRELELAAGGGWAEEHDSYGGIALAPATRTV